MIEFYKTINNITRKIENLEKGCWINVTSPAEKEIDYLINEIKILPEFIKRCLDSDESSYIDYDENLNQVLIIVDYPNKESMEDREFLQFTIKSLGVIIMNDYIVTISIQENLVIDDMIKGRIKGLDTKLKNSFLLFLLLRISQSFLFYLRQIDKESSQIEKVLHQSMRNRELFIKIGLEKSLVYFTTSLKSNEIILNKIMRGKVIKLDDYDQNLLDDAIIENKHAIELCNIYSKILSGTMDAFASVISNNLNNVMKILTVITIVMAIPNMIFSFYGMNVDGLPFAHWCFPLVFSFFICIIVSWIFKKKDLFH